MLRGQAAEVGDEGLVALARKGGNKAFEVLVERYKQKAYRIAFHFTRDREEAKDLSQEALLRAFTNMKGFDRQSSFYTWFYRILVNLCVDYQRRRKRVAWESINEKADKIAENLEFFKAMDLLDSLDLLEARGGPGSGSA